MPACARSPKLFEKVEPPFTLFLNAEVLYPLAELKATTVVQNAFFLLRRQQQCCCSGVELVV